MRASQGCRTCLKLLELFQIKLVNINSSDLVDGRPPVVLGLIWTIILYFQVCVQIEALYNVHGFAFACSTYD
jgi:nesprin-1